MALQDFNIQCGNVIEHRRPGIIVVEKKHNRYVIVDITRRPEGALQRTGEVDNYQDL